MQKKNLENINLELIIIDDKSDKGFSGSFKFYNKKI